MPQLDVVNVPQLAGWKYYVIVAKTGGLLALQQQTSFSKFATHFQQNIQSGKKDIEASLN